MSGFYDDASWVLIPEGIKEDVVYAQKPTDGLGDLTFTRASDATRTNSAGVIERTPWNLFQFSEMFSDGIWVKSGGGTGVAAVVTPNTVTSPIGTLTADTIVFNSGAGTTNADQSVISQTVTTVVGATYTISVYLKGSVGGEKILLRKPNYDYELCTLTTEWQRFTTTTPAILTSSILRIEVRQGIAGIGTINSTATIYAWGAQLVEGTDAKPYFATTNRQDVPRLDYRNADGSVSTCPRLLLEPQRTNSIRNSTMVGAVAGSPGTLPTNWLESLGGLTRQVVGIGTENGIQYVDLRFSGTATDTLFRLFTEASNQIVASNGQTWTTSNYIKAVAAPSPPSSYLIEIFERTAAGVFVTSGGTAIVPTSNLERFTFTRTLVGGATVERTQPTIRAVLVIGAAYDFTIRIAAPQMELGAYATTFIPTTTAAVTRLSDRFSRGDLFTNGLVSAAGGTLFLDLRIPFALRDNGNENISLSDATAQNQLFLYGGIGGNTYILAKIVSGVSSNVYFSPVSTANNIKIAIKWNGTSADVFQNGVKVVSSTAFTATTSLQFLRSNNAVGSIVQINQSALFPVPMTDEKCIEITTL